jgi:hypothetical protein
MEGRISKRNTETSSNSSFLPGFTRVPFSASMVLVPFTNTPFVDFEFYGFTGLLLIISAADLALTPAFRALDMASLLRPVHCLGGFFST